MYRTQTYQNLDESKSYLNKLFESYERYASSDIIGKINFVFWEIVKDIFTPLDNHYPNLENARNYDCIVLMNNPY